LLCTSATSEFVYGYQTTEHTSLNKQVAATYGTRLDVQHWNNHMVLVNYVK